MSRGEAWTTEKDFYLAEFRGRSIGIALPGADLTAGGALEAVLRELSDNDTRVVLFGDAVASLDAIAGEALRPELDPAWSARLWRRLATSARAGVVLPATDFAAACRDAVLRLRLAKLVWIDPRGALRDAAGGRISSVPLDGPSDPVTEGRLAGEAAAVPLEAFGAMLAGGVASVSLCRLEDLAEELFTYRGAGTFFSRARYTDVRPLALDEFAAAARLIAQGVAEGFLAPRNEAQVDALLSHGFGVFIEGRYLAGLGSLIPYETARVAEIAGLYTVTRFAGEGVGGHLVGHALARADRDGFGRVFACTTSERVEGFFQRHGFERIEPSEVPAEKWQGYPDERRSRLYCLARKTR